MWNLILRSGAALSVVMAGIQLFDLFFREIRPHRIYSSDEAALLLGIDRRKVIQLVRQGAIQCNKVDGNYRILGQSLLDYLKQ